MDCFALDGSLVRSARSSGGAGRVERLRCSLGARVQSLAWILVALVVGASDAGALSVAYEYTGYLDASPIGLGVNEAVHIRYGFDTTTADLNPSPSSGRYELQSLSVTVGAFTATLTNPGPSQSVLTILDNSNGIDAYSVATNPVGSSFSGLLNGFQLQSAGFTVSDGVSTTWSGDSLVLNASLLNALTYTSMQLVFAQGTLASTPPAVPSGFQLLPRPFSITSVPEPSSGLLIVIGLVALAAGRPKA